MGLRQLVRNLILAVGALPTARTICTVLIGSGEGTLTVEDAVRGLVDGIGEAVDETEAGEDLALRSPGGSGPHRRARARACSADPP